MGFRRGLEGVAVGRRGQEVSGLEVNDASEEGGEGRIGGGGGGGEQWQVGLQLVGAVTEPHGVYVARYYEGEFFEGVGGRVASPADGGVERVGIGILEESVEVWVGNFGFHLGEEGFDF